MPFSPEILAIIAIALFFDFSNGFHDAANSIATVVSTRVLTPRLAVAWAAFFNFAAFLIFGVHVARTIAKGIVRPEIVTPDIVLAALKKTGCRSKIQRPRYRGAYRGSVQRGVGRRR